MKKNEVEKVILIDLYIEITINPKLSYNKKVIDKFRKLLKETPKEIIIAIEEIASHDLSFCEHNLSELNSKALPDKSKILKLEREFEAITTLHKELKKALE